MELAVNKSFWFGVGVGIVGTWGYHAFVKRLPSKG